MSEKSKTVWQFQRLIEYLEHMPAQPESVGLDIQDVDVLEVIKYKSKGYSKPAKVRNVKKVHFEKLDFEAPTREAVVPLLKEIVKQLQTKGEFEQTTRERIESIIGKLAPYGSWATLAYNILHNYGLI